MKTITISAADFPAAVYEEVERFHVELIRAMRITAARGKVVTMDSINRARPRPPVDTGRYRASWMIENTDDGAIMYNAMIYAAVMELGRRAGSRMPPQSVIERWVKRKLKPKTPRELKALTFLIRRAIKTKGIKGRRVLARSMPSIKKIAKEEIDAAAARVARTTQSTGGA